MTSRDEFIFKFLKVYISKELPQVQPVQLPPPTQEVVLPPPTQVALPLHTQTVEPQEHQQDELPQPILDDKALPSQTENKSIANTQANRVHDNIQTRATVGNSLLARLKTRLNPFAKTGQIYGPAFNTLYTKQPPKSVRVGGKRKRRK